MNIRTPTQLPCKYSYDIAQHHAPLIKEAMRAIWRLPEHWPHPSERRQAEAEPKAIATYFMSSIKNMTLVQIAEQMGYMNHTSVIHAIKTVKGYLHYNRQYRNMICRIHQDIIMRCKQHDQNNNNNESNTGI